MGTPIPPPTIPDPVPAGENCPVCWGTGKPFLSGGTPESILITLFGIRKGPNWLTPDSEPVQGEFTLLQDGDLPCLFSAPVGNDVGFVVFAAGLTAGLIGNPTGSPMFTANPSNPCMILLANQTNDHFVGGTMKITIPKVI